jgi:cob(I)alamin adenosyltransferase
MGAKVTTKTGDKGSTRTLGGDTVSKSDIIIECSGWLDTSRAQTARLRILLLDSDNEQYQAEAAFLLWLLHVYFLMGCYVNDPDNVHPEYRPCEFTDRFLTRLEAEQNRLQVKLELPNAFIVSANNALSAECDVLATTVRTFERNLVRLHEAHPNFEGGQIIPFINRLSDYCFVLARHLENRHYQVVDYKILET